MFEEMREKVGGCIGKNISYRKKQEQRACGRSGSDEFKEPQGVIIAGTARRGESPECEVRRSQCWTMEELQRLH